MSGSIQYILFVVLNEVKLLTKILKKLRAIGIERFTVMDTMGSTSLCDAGKTEFSPIIAGTVKSSEYHMGQRYNKTIFVVLNSEDEANFVMDEIEGVLNMDVEKPGKGIMFTVPIYSSHGVRNQDVEFSD